MTASHATTIPTEPILVRVAAGDAGAINECMDRFGGLVWSLARRLCSSPADAEDAVQEIFIDVWKSAHRYDAGIASETTFVAMIARRRLIDRNRRKQRRPEIPALADDAIASTDHEVDRTEISEDATIAATAFKQLRSEQQQVLQLAIQHGCSHEQIATTTGMPLGTVKTHARRGLIKLRELLENEKRRREGGAQTDDSSAGGRTDNTASSAPGRSGGSNSDTARTDT